MADESGHTGELDTAAMPASLFDDVEPCRT
jgi:hypothetical protein